MTYTTERSEALYQRTAGVLIEGGSSASRGPATFGDYPLFMERAEGSRILDVDGNSYIDWMMGFGVLPLGHAHPAVTQAIVEAATSGAHLATATEIEVEVAELIQRITPAAERVRFANTGTEAVMAAIRLARGYTGRPKIIKFEGHYHGWYDDVLVNSNPQLFTALGHPRDPVKIADSSGLNRHALEDTILVPWNDLAAVERAIAAYPGQIAAILTEGVMANMGIILPAPGFLQGLQDLANAHQILFILDETVTGFRIAPGGCAEHFGLRPDLTIYGKALGAGLPLAAFVGKAEIMAALGWGGVLHYGTQNASRIGLYAARASLRVLTADDGGAYHHVWRIADALCSGWQGLFAQRQIPALVQQFGPMLHIVFTDRPAIRDYRDFCRYVDRGAYTRYVRALFAHGIYLTPMTTLHSVVTLAHTEEDVALTLEAAGKAMDDVFR
ncbi:MAG TPA: aspartate aminotransferase family protein [Chloroflexota bacterium]|nr:aspartate aminotransferase family protein [Chloroflexota bacterium]